MTRCGFSLALSLVIVSINGLQMNLAFGQPAKLEVRPFTSKTLTDEQILTGAADGAEPVTIAGELRIPRARSDKLAAVILLQASGGFGSNLDRWFRELNSLGIATFAVDSLAGRGIADTLTDQSQLSRLAMMIDAYRALDTLAKHPRIDPTRIALMGFSRGGQSALHASMRRFQQMHGTPGLEFLAYVPIYAASN